MQVTTLYDLVNNAHMNNVPVVIPAYLHKQVIGECSPAMVTEIDLSRQGEIEYDPSSELFTEFEGE